MKYLWLCKDKEAFRLFREPPQYDKYSDGWMWEAGEGLLNYGVTHGCGDIIVWNHSAFKAVYPRWYKKIGRAGSNAIIKIRRDSIL